MNAISWLLFAMLPCIIQAFRPPFVVARQPRVTKMVSPDSGSVVWVSPTFRFRRSLDVAKRSADEESVRFDPTVCDDDGNCLPVSGPVSLERSPVAFSLGLRKESGNGLDAQIKRVLQQSGRQQNKLRKFRRSYNDILRYGRSLNLQIPCSDCEEDKNLYAYSRAILYPSQYSDFSENKGSDTNENRNFIMESQSADKGSSSLQSIVKRDVHSPKDSTQHENYHTTMPSGEISSAHDVTGSGIEDSSSSF
ncbi:uncharacterized protein [Palaemon carinicauda]|uniref:uncharacterized protein n=1 Tax=Palaemon carinicauda TaxID=392227 RepID=UPI0035B57D53